ncbi:MAG: DUF4140 domain-containing protein, partial [Planctomycetota bacterium]
MNRLAVYLSFCLLVAGSSADAQEAATPIHEEVGVIRRVTLYRDRALVTREITVPAGEKWRSVNVPDLPETVAADSVYADGVAGTLVRAV